MISLCLYLWFEFRCGSLCVRIYRAERRLYFCHCLYTLMIKGHSVEGDYCGQFWLATKGDLGFSSMYIISLKYCRAFGHVLATTRIHLVYLDHLGLSVCLAKLLS